MSIDYNKCAYMNPEKQNANVMMRPCINGSDPLVWPCIERETLDKDIFSLVTERPQGDNVQEIKKGPYIPSVKQGGQVSVLLPSFLR